MTVCVRPRILNNKVIRAPEHPFSNYNREEKQGRQLQLQGHNLSKSGKVLANVPTNWLLPLSEYVHASLTVSRKHSEQNTIFAQNLKIFNKGIWQCKLYYFSRAPTLFKDGIWAEMLITALGWDRGEMRLRHCTNPFCHLYCYHLSPHCQNLLKGVSAVEYSRQLALKPQPV